jgi:D-3-phosphoglycerate dehydrogenase / 2-oxoglutarate reductase
MQKILVTAADLAKEALALLTDYEVVFAGKTPNAADVTALCKAHNPVAIIVRYGRIDAPQMDAAPLLKVISKHGSGIDTIDSAAAGKRGIAVVAATAVNADAVAEHSLALMLAAAKSVIGLNERMHAGHWDKSTHKSLELRGKTVGLVGLGAIGLRFAMLCKALGMRALGHDPFANPERCKAAGVEIVDLATVLRGADVLSLHCPLTPENKGFINAETLTQCKRGVIFINTARGGLVDEAAMLAAVQSGQVGTAALDSFAVEPFTAPHPFQNQAGFILSPHIGGVTSDAYVNMGVAAAQNVLNCLKG